MRNFQSKQHRGVTVLNHMIDTFENDDDKWMISLRILNAAYMESSVGNQSVVLSNVVTKKILHGCIYRLCYGMDKNCEISQKKIQVIVNLFKIVAIDDLPKTMDVEAIRLMIKKYRNVAKGSLYYEYYRAILDCLIFANPENVQDISFEILLNKSNVSASEVMRRDIQDMETQLILYTLNENNLHLAVEYTKRCNFSSQFSYEKVNTSAVFLVYDLLKLNMLSLSERLYLEDLMIKISSLIQLKNVSIDNAVHYSFMSELIISSSIVYDLHVFQKILTFMSDGMFDKFLMNDPYRYFRHCCTLITRGGESVKIRSRLLILIRSFIGRSKKIEHDLLENGELMQSIFKEGLDFDFYNWIREDHDKYYAEKGHYAHSILLYLKKNPLWKTVIKDIQFANISECCIICCTREKRTVLIPCGHVVTCETCSTTLKKCPLCRCDIRETNPIYL